MEKRPYDVNVDPCFLFHGGNNFTLCILSVFALGAFCIRLLAIFCFRLQVENAEVQFLYGEEIKSY